MTGLKAEEQLKQENGNIFSNKEKISSVLKTAVKDKLAQMDCLIDDDLPNYIMIMMANRKSKKEMTEALTLFLNDRTNDFTTWLYQMLDSIRKRREKIKEIEDKKEANNNKNSEEDNLDEKDELEIGVGEEDDLDRELIGDAEVPKKPESKPQSKSQSQSKPPSSKPKDDVKKSEHRPKGSSVDRKSKNESKSSSRNDKSKAPIQIKSSSDDKKKKLDQKKPDSKLDQKKPDSKLDQKKPDSKRDISKTEKSKSKPEPKIKTDLKKVEIRKPSVPKSKPETDKDKKKRKPTKDTKKDTDKSGTDIETKKKAKEAKEAKPDLRKMLESKRKRKNSDNKKNKKSSSSSSSSSSSDSSSSEEEPAKKKKKKVDAKTAKKLKGKKKTDKSKAKKRKVKKDESSSESDSDDEKKNDDKNLKDLVIMVKNNETAAQKKKKRRRKTRDMRDKMSKLAKLNGESGSGGSGNEESDKSKKAKKQRSLERKERSLLKQKKRLMRLTEKAQKSGGEMTGQELEQLGGMQSGHNQQNNVGNILYMPVDGKLQAVQIVQHQGMTMLAPVGLQHASQSGLTPSQSSGTAGSALGAPIFGQSAKLASPPQISPLLGSSLGTNSLGPVNPSPLVANSINSTSFASLAHSSSTVGGASVNVGELPLVKTDTKLINNVAAGSLKGVVPDASMKPTDIDTLKKKLAMMERETQRLREMHKLRLKKLETKQRAQEERSKRDAEIQRRQDEEDARTVYVRNLHPKIKEQQLRDHFSVFGAIKRIVLPQDAHSIGCNRGFTFITFASKEPVEVSCSLDGTLFHERSIKVVPKTNMMGKIRPQHLVH